MMVVTQAGVADIESVLPVMDRAFDPQYGEAWTANQCVSMLSLPGTRFVIGQVDGCIAGFAMMRTVMDESELLLIAVDPRNAGRGMGGKLLDYVVTESAALGAKKLHVEVRSDNRAHQFYASKGFVEVGKRPNYYRRKDGGPTHAITLVYQINL
jgi:[ribosomal protein S18]-alanine N-acetyltransferase